MCDGVLQLLQRGTRYFSFKDSIGGAMALVFMVETLAAAAMVTRDSVATASDHPDPIR